MKSSWFAKRELLCLSSKTAHILLRQESVLEVAECCSATDMVVVEEQGQ